MDILQNRRIITGSWGGKDNKQYRLLLIVIAIIFFITSITVQFFETAVSDYFCDSGVLYRSVSYILLVQTEF